MKELIASASALVVVLLTTAFGYGKMKQNITNIKETTTKDVITIKDSIKTFTEDNKEEHGILFEEVRKITKHMGAVEKYMEMQNGKDKP